MTKFYTLEGHEIKANTLYEMVIGGLFFISTIKGGHVYGITTDCEDADGWDIQDTPDFLLRPHQPIPGAYTEDGTPICIGWEYKRRDGSVERIVAIDYDGAIKGQRISYYTNGRVIRCEKHEEDLITRHIPTETEEDGDSHIEDAKNYVLETFGGTVEMHIDPVAIMEATKKEPEDEGWIKHDGKGVPELADSAIIDFKFMGGSIVNNWPISRFLVGWKWDDTFDEYMNIMEYRIKQE